MSNKQFLIEVYNRLRDVYLEDPESDMMKRILAFIEAMPSDA